MFKLVAKAAIPRRIHPKFFVGSPPNQAIGQGQKGVVAAGWGPQVSVAEHHERVGPGKFRLKMNKGAVPKTVLPPKIPQKIKKTAIADQYIISFNVGCISVNTCLCKVVHPNTFQPQVGLASAGREGINPQCHRTIAKVDVSEVIVEGTSQKMQSVPGPGQIPVKGVQTVPLHGNRFLGSALGAQGAVDIDR